jgi:phosphatidyl-myo-inositol dimannoside synthase
MKRTLTVSLEYPPQIGGIATYVHNLVSALDPQSSFLLAPREIGDGYTGEDIRDWDSSVAYSVTRERLLSSIMWPRWLRLCRILSRIVRDRSIDLVMVHHALPVGYAALFVKRFRRVPYILFSHGTDIAEGGKSAWKRRMVRMVATGAEALVFNSQSLKRRFLEIYPQFESKSIVMYPCPERSFLERPPQEEINDIIHKYALEGKRVIMSMARIVPGKGFHKLVRMMPDILKKIPNLVWIIIGDGPAKQDILEMIQAENLQNVVRFAGKVPHTTVRKFYYLSDLFILLTHPYQGMEEGLGLVFLEAAATGTAVVAGKSGGVEEAVISDETGLVVDVDSDMQIDEEIIELLNDDVRRNKYAEQARARIISDFTWEKELQKLLNYL